MYLSVASRLTTLSLLHVIENQLRTLAGNWTSKVNYCDKRFERKSMWCDDLFRHFGSWHGNYRVELPVMGKRCSMLTQFESKTDIVWRNLNQNTRSW